ncbi:OLC1v1000469C1 [Oldenlandia corymbosa var. corymbosa]|uniref:mitogen-activated protein kinase kinase kinase n=1 Tax=Oldenlandia corymbosa var. corymbosa TaxID=529605 RepID=A0AAV1D3C2_OLDCO|nr:OLC1v1000469C1 [Oldenlandia corymbosa var. corymbosa]
MIMNKRLEDRRVVAGQILSAHARKCTSSFARVTVCTLALTIQSVLLLLLNYWLTIYRELKKFRLVEFIAFFFASERWQLQQLKYGSIFISDVCRQGSDDFIEVRRSLVFRTPPNVAPDFGGGGSGGREDGRLVDKINSCIRKSRVFNKPSPPSLPQPSTRDNNAAAVPPIRWRRGEMIGCGAFGQVYMGMNLDSGELIAVKQVLIPANCASNKKTQDYVRELEEEVKLLKNLSHANIVRYLGTVREEVTLNILLEFVPGGSISSLLGKFGSFPETVIKMYTKQLLEGLHYLHQNGIMHRDIKGANILVDNKGCIKLADFGASKQVVELANASGAKSMKGTPYWMAPEVIRQTGHSFSADIWSVGCTVIEMATGKPPWSHQYKEVAAFFFYIGTTKEHPPIPECLSPEAKDFLLKCLQKEPELRPPAFELLQHPFVTGKVMPSPIPVHTSTMESSEAPLLSVDGSLNVRGSSEDICNLGTLDFSTPYPKTHSEGKHLNGQTSSDFDLCRLDEKDELLMTETNTSPMMPDEFCKSFNPMSEPCDDWRSQLDASPGGERSDTKVDLESEVDGSPLPGVSNKDFSSSSPPSLFEDDDEVTESKIQAFLNEKVQELKRLETPLFEEFHNSFNPLCSPKLSEATRDETGPKILKLPPKSRSPSQTPSSAVKSAVDRSPGSSSKRMPHVGVQTCEDQQQNFSPQTNDLNVNLADAQDESSPNVSEIQRKWKEELAQELERKRVEMRQAGAKTSSPKDRALNRHRERSRGVSDVREYIRVQLSPAGTGYEFSHLVNFLVSVQRLYTLSTITERFTAPYCQD